MQRFGVKPEALLFFSVIYKENGYEWDSLCNKRDPGTNA